MSSFTTRMSLLGEVLRRPILRDVSWYTLGQIGVQLFAFAGVMITGRYLGPINLGLYSFVQNYLATCMAVLGSMEFYFTWEIAQSTNKFHDLKKYIGHKLYVTALITIVGVFVAWYTLPSDVAMLTTLLFTPFILGSTSGFYCYAVAEKKAKMVSLAQISSAGIIFLTKCFLVFTNASLKSFAFMSGVEVVLLTTILTTLYLSRTHIRQELSRTPMPTLRDTVRFMYGIRMSMFAILSWQLIVRVDQFFLALLTNAYTLGIYASAVKIAEMPNFLGGILYNALVNHVSLFANKEDSYSKQKIKNVFLAYLSIGTWMALGIIIFAPLLVSIIYGEKFLDAVPVLRIYALSIPGLFLCQHFFAIYGAKKKHLFQTVTFIIGIMINIALMYVFVPHSGPIGAAAATAIAYSFLGLAFYIHSR